MTDRELLQMALDALKDWDSLIKHQYNGSREAMSDLTVCAQSTPPIIEALCAALAQPEQEPVAWWHDMGDVVDLNVSGHGKPLYFAIPQREWVGLTHEEIGAMEKEYLFGGKEFDDEIGYWAVYRAIEAKLKEKNT